MPPDLTKTRLKILQLTLQLGTKATIRTVAKHLDMSHEAVRLQVGILRDLGYLEVSQNRFSPLVLTQQAKRELNVGIPIYGEVAAGPPTLTEQPTEFTPDLETLIGMREGDYLLKIRGDSMIGIGVMPGDYVIVRPGQDVLDGEVAVVTFPGEQTGTLKRVTRFVDKILLHSENPEYGPMSFPMAEVQIQGKMIGKIGLQLPRTSRRR